MQRHLAALDWSTRRTKRRRRARTQTAQEICLVHWVSLRWPSIRCLDVASPRILPACPTTSGWMPSISGVLWLEPVPDNKPDCDDSSQSYRRDNHEDEEAKVIVFAKLSSGTGASGGHLVTDHALRSQPGDGWCAENCRKRCEKRSVTGTHGANETTQYCSWAIKANRSSFSVSSTFDDHALPVVSATMRW